MSTFLTKADDNEKGFPKGVPYIIGNEGCERFSYYGMKAILYVFLWKTYLETGLFTDVGAAQTEATAIVHEFNAAVYALPMIGALIADRFVGKYSVIMWLSVVYCIGHAFLAIFETNITGFYAGLALIAIGSGGIKPCVSAHVGDQFGKSNMNLLQSVFKIFYFIINFGSMFAAIFIPLFYQWWGAGVAFGIPGILMGVATVFFWLGRNTFVHVPASPGGKLGFLDSLSGSLMFLTVGSLFFTAQMSVWAKVAISGSFLVSGLALFFYRQKLKQDHGFLAMTLVAVKDFVTGKKVENPKAGTHEGHWLYGTVAKKFGHEKADGPLSVWSIMSIFFMVSVFWALFDQHSSTWIRQAEQMDGSNLFKFPAMVFSSLDLSPMSPIFTFLLFILLIAIIFYITHFLINKTFKVGLKGIFLFSTFVSLALIGGHSLGVFKLFMADVTLLPSQMPASNPILVMLLIPFTTYVLYPFINKFFKLTPLRTMTIGMIMASSSFGAVYLIEKMIIQQGVGQVSMLWQLVPFGLLTLSEVMVSITGLEFAYTQAPKSMKSTVMGFWLLTVSLGNVLTSLLARFAKLDLADFFLVFAGLMLCAGVIFGILAKFYRVKDYTK